jgi:hypothetical protein
MMAHYDTLVLMIGGLALFYVIYYLIRARAYTYIYNEEFGVEEFKKGEE